MALDLDTPATKMSPKCYTARPILWKQASPGSSLLLDLLPLLPQSLEVSGANLPEKVICSFKL